MPQAVAPWTWHRVLRDDGPRGRKDHGYLWALSVLRTYMNKEGVAYPSLSTWAKGARMTPRTVQRYLDRARREGWLSVFNAGRGGHGWKFNGYRCCVPHSVQLKPEDEIPANYIAGVLGEIEGPDTMVSSGSPSSGVPRCPAVSKGTTPGAEGNDTADDKRSRHPDVVLTLTQNSRSPEEAPLTRSRQQVSEAEGEPGTRRQIPDSALSEDLPSYPNTDAGSRAYLDDDNMQALCEELDYLAFCEEEFEWDFRRLAWVEYEAWDTSQLTDQPPDIDEAPVGYSYEHPEGICEQEKEREFLFQAYAEYESTNWPEVA